MNWSGYQRPIVTWLSRFALAVVLVLAEGAAADTESDSIAIGEAYDAWERAANARDIELWASYLAPNATFMPADAEPLTTKQSILDYYRKSFADPNFSLDCQQLSIDIAGSRDMAWSSGKCHATFTNSDGEKAAGGSQWIKIWLKQADGSWKCRVNAWDYVDEI